MPDLVWQPPWQDIEHAKRDGNAIFAHGIHTGSPQDAQRGVKAGDEWWAILVWDIWREPQRWIFAKDGAPAWSEPDCFQPIESPRRVTREQYLAWAKARALEACAAGDLESAVASMMRNLRQHPDWLNKVSDLLLAHGVTVIREGRAAVERWINGFH